MLKIAICEDERYMLIELKQRVHDFLKEANIDAHISCFELGISLLSSHDFYDVIIMDIKMSGMNGLEVVRRLRANSIHSQVIFVTSSQDYVFQAFDVDAVHYLMKPVSNENLFRALNKALWRTDQIDKHAITITKGNFAQVIPFRNILYFEAVAHKIYVYTDKGKKDYYGKFDTLEHLLDARFFRCHRSYIVNMNFIMIKDNHTIFMTNGDKVLVSRRKEHMFKNRLLSYIHNEVL